jgi:hypothetical protein
MNVLEIPLATHLSRSVEKSFADVCFYLHPELAGVDIGKRSIRLSFVNDAPIDDQELTTNVTEMLKSFSSALGEVEDEIVLEQPGWDIRTDDAWAALQDRELVHEVEPGLCYLIGRFSDACDRLDQIFRDYAATLKATPAAFGTVLPISSAMENQYLANFPHHAFFVATAHQSLASIKSIAECARGGRQLGSRVTGPVRYLLAPTVCYHCFEALRGRTVAPGTVYTAKGPCHRFETQNADRLIRLHVFNMREIIFYESSAFVDEMRSNILQFCVDLLGRQWGCRLRVVTANDPFFGPAHDRRLYQAMKKSKYELQLHLAHCDRWLPVMSFNHHEHKLATHYRIKPDGIASGCFGVGYERLLYALSCQKGVDHVLDRFSQEGRP